MSNIQWVDETGARRETISGYEVSILDFAMPMIIVRAADLGVSVSVVGRTLETMLGSSRVTTYEDRGEEYEVVLQAEASPPPSGIASHRSAAGRWCAASPGKGPRSRCGGRCEHPCLPRR